MVTVPRDYGTLESFEYLETMFPGFQASGLYRTHALEEHRGSLSWGASLVARSYLRLYESSGDHKYLRAFIGIGEQMLLARDSVRGVVDYAGRSNPVWRSGRPYTTNLVAFRCAESGANCVEIRAKQASRIQIMNVQSESATMDVAFLDATGAVLASYEGVSLDPGQEDSLPEVLAKRGWKTPLAAAVVSHSRCTACLPESGIYELEEQFYAPAVHVSQICLALLEFCKIINEDNALRKTYGAYSESYLEAAIRALEVYEEDYRQPQNAGYYLIPRDAPSDFEGTDAPLNHNMSMASCFLLLYRVTGELEYKERAEALLTTFRMSLTRMDLADRTCLVWPYFVPFLLNYGGTGQESASRWRTGRKGNARMEDMSHAVLSVEAAITAHELGIEITATDLRYMANTFVSATSTGTMSNYVDGTAGYGKYDDIAGRWAVLSPWAREVHTISRDVMQAKQPQPVHASILLASANLATA